jgi:hypothetical protein
VASPPFKSQRDGVFPFQKYSVSKYVLHYSLFAPMITKDDENCKIND